MARKPNYFSVLDDEEDKSAASILAPSILSGAEIAEPAVSRTSLASDLGTSTRRASESRGIDLASVAAEIGAEKPGDPSSWDFSSLHSSATEHQRLFEKELEDKQKAHEARLLALHKSDQALREKLRIDAATSRKERLRKEMGKDFNDRFGNKVVRRSEAQKRRNQAKHAY